MSTGNEGFDKLSANGNLLKSVPLGLGRNNSDYNTATNAVILGSDPDSAPNRLLRHHRITESGSDPNITAPGQTRYQLDSCQRFLDKRCRPFFRIARATPWLPQPASCHGPQNWGQIPIRVDATAPALTIGPNWDLTPNLLPPVFSLASVETARGLRQAQPEREPLKDVVGNNSPFCTKELGCTARRKTRRLSLIHISEPTRPY